MADKLTVPAAGKKSEKTQKKKIPYWKTEKKATALPDLSDEELAGAYLDAAHRRTQNAVRANILKRIEKEMKDELSRRGILVPDTSHLTEKARKQLKQAVAYLYEPNPLPARKTH